MIDEMSQRLNQETDARTNQAVDPLPLASADARGIEDLRKRWANLPMIPRVVHVRTEGRDVSWPGFDVRTLLIGEESGGRFTYHDLIVAPGAELPPHHLPGADTYLCMLEGELRLTVGDLTEIARKDAFAYVPDDATQAMKNVSSRPARAMMWHTPAGTERAFAAAHALWLERPDAPADAILAVLSDFGFRFHKDDERQPSDGMTNKAADRVEARIETLDDFMALRKTWSQRRPIPKLLHDWRTAQDVHVPGQDTKVFLSGDEGSGRCVVFHYGIHPGYEAPTHHQPTEEETFLVLEGAMTLTAGNVTTELGVGGLGFVPRYGTHAFTNAMKEGLVRTMTVNSPAGHERAFAAAVQEMLKPEGPSEKLPQILSAHGWTFHEEVNHIRSGQ